MRSRPGSPTSCAEAAGRTAPPGTVADLVAGDGVEHGGGVTHRAGDRAVDRRRPNPRRGSGAWVTRPRDGLSTDDAALGRRCGRSPPRGGRRRRWTPRRRLPSRPRIPSVEWSRFHGLRRPVGDRLGGDRAAQFGRVGAADGDEPGLAEAPPQRRVARRDVRGPLQGAQALAVSPAIAAPRSLTTIGTPANGPSPSASPVSASARSKRGWG